MNPVRDRRGSASRKIVLIDLENMLFGDHEGQGQAQNRSKEILGLAQARRPGDNIIVGCNPQLVFLAAETFPGSQIVTGKGKDGADMALIEALDLGRAIERYDELVIVSGDHLFCEVAHPARKAGLPVRIVAPHAGLSTALRVFADTAVFLPDDADSSPATVTDDIENFHDIDDFDDGTPLAA